MMTKNDSFKKNQKNQIFYEDNKFLKHNIKKKSIKIYLIKKGKKFINKEQK